MVKVPVFYVTPDPLKACGLEHLISNFHLITLYSHPVLSVLKNRGVSVLCLQDLGMDISDPKLKNTGQILAISEVEKYIKDASGSAKPNILVFKPSQKIDILCSDRGYNLIGNSTALGEIFEEKTSFWQIAQNLGLPVPKGLISKFSEVSYSEIENELKLPFVIQFGRGWAGNSTFFINSEDDFKKVLDGNEYRNVKITEYIDGSTYLNNVCLYGDKVFASYPAIQLPDPQGKHHSATYGRQWSVTNNKDIVDQIDLITQKLGKYISASGYKGWLGFDFLVDKKGIVYVSECNARLTASASFFTQCEIKSVSKAPLFLYHLASFLPGDKLEDWVRCNFTGSEFVVRNEEDKNIIVSNPSRSGVYKYVPDIIFDREAEGVIDLSQNEMFVSFPSKGEIVPPNEALSVTQIDKVIYENSSYNSTFDKVANLISFR